LLARVKQEELLSTLSAHRDNERFTRPGSQTEHENQPRAGTVTRSCKKTEGITRKHSQLETKPTGNTDQRGQLTSVQDWKKTAGKWNA
jgi:hypothetical protein